MGSVDSPPLVPGVGVGDGAMRAAGGDVTAGAELMSGGRGAVGVVSLAVASAGGVLGAVGRMVHGSDGDAGVTDPGA